MWPSGDREGNIVTGITLNILESSSMQDGSDVHLLVVCAKCLSLKQHVGCTFVNETTGLAFDSVSMCSAPTNDNWGNHKAVKKPVRERAEDDIYCHTSPRTTHQLWNGRKSASRNPVRKALINNAESKGTLSSPSLSGSRLAFESRARLTLFRFR